MSGIIDPETIESADEETKSDVIVFTDNPTLNLDSVSDLLPGDMACADTESGPPTLTDFCFGDSISSSDDGSDTKVHLDDSQDSGSVVIELGLDLNDASHESGIKFHLKDHEAGVSPDPNRGSNSGISLRLTDDDDPEY